MTEQAAEHREAGEDEFVPRGAMAFMVFMALSYGAIWLFFYYLMVGRP